MPQRYAIKHVTQFTYADAVSESVMEVRLRPATDDLQHCLQFAIDVQPRARTFAYQDFLGNWVHHFNVPRRHRELVVTTRAHVEVDERPAVPEALPAGAWSEIQRWADETAYWEFRQESQFARGSELLLAFMRSLGVDNRSMDPLSTVRRVMSAIFEQFEYAPNTTRVDSPVDEAIGARRGVCQDFSHIMIAMLRQAGLPARYVSGYIASSSDPPALEGVGRGSEEPGLDTNGSSASSASHAWVEACLPELGWIGFDPTHNVVTSDRHVRVAVGRDYADVPPTRGVFKGKTAGTLEVTVTIARAERPEPVPSAPDVREQPASWAVSRPEDPTPQQQQQQQQQLRTRN
jgi:transglutaminase-like putative cysteine protease